MASLARELGSPAAFSLDPTTPRETRRSSSRASRKTTREPESHASNHSQSSYSLPPTPVTTSFEESFPSAKRRKTQRSVNQTTQTPKGKESTETPNTSTSKGSVVSSQATDSVSKRRDRNRKAVTSNGELTSNTGSPSEPAVPQTKPRPEQSQSTLHHFLLKKTQPKRHSLATTTLPTSTSPRVTSSASSTPRALSTSASTPRVTSTPVSTRKDRNPKSAETPSSDVAKTPAEIKTESAPVETATKHSSTQDKNSSKPQTPIASSRPSTPLVSTSRARRTDRKAAGTTNPSRLNPAIEHTQSTPIEQISTPTTSSNMGNAKSVPSRASKKGSTRPQRSSRRSLIEPETRSQTPNYLNSNSAKASDLSSGAESLTPALPFGREIAESIESTTPASDDKILRDFGTPILDETPGATPYGDSFNFEYDTDMYRNNFGLDGTTETPGSPTGSLTTATSAGNRISTRLRKPTIKAMESIESERRFRRPPRSTSARPDGPKGPPLRWDAVALGIQIFDLANAALAPEFEPVAEAENWLAELRGEYEVKHAEKEKVRLERERLEKEREEREEKEKELREKDEKETAEKEAQEKPNGQADVAEKEIDVMEKDVDIMETEVVENGEKNEAEKASSMPEIAEKANAEANIEPNAEPDAEPDAQSASKKESAEKESAKNDSAEKDSAEKDSAEKDSAEKDSAKKDSAEKEKAESEAEKTSSPAEQLPKVSRPQRPVRATRNKRPLAEEQPSNETKTKDKAKARGASKPTSSRDKSKEWTDEDGFTYTGQVNKFGEELVYVGGEYEWYRPNNTYGDDKLPLPPVRLISRDQLEKDRIFGFPPLMGERNIPRATHMPFTYENVYEERAKIKARDEARKRGIEVDRFMPSAAIHALIAEHDKTSSDKDKSGSGVEHKGPAPRKRRRGAEQPTEAAQAAKRRRKEDTPPHAADQPKTLRIKLTLKGAAAAAAAAGNGGSPNDSSKKRTRSEIESAPEANGVPDSKTPQGRPSKLLKLSGLRRDPVSTPSKSTATPASPGDGNKNATATPAPAPVPTPATAPAPQASTPVTEASTAVPGTTPGGRPRRRAAAALMAEFQTHAEQRARRANARKKEPTT